MSAHLTAVYTSPTATNTFSSPLSSAPTEASSSHEKSQYLADLRDNVSQMQDDINQFLTKKMDEDKAATDAPVTSNDEDMEEQITSAGKLERTILDLRRGNERRQKLVDGHSVESEKVAAVKALKCLRRGPPCEAQEDLEILITLAGREYIAKHLMHFSLSATKIGTIGNDEKLKDLQPKLEKCIKSIEESGTQVTAAMTVDCDLFVHALIQVLEEEQSRLPF
ncbi:hypothetical protein D6D13_05068 [Aureobasidium pullulans]|uniref:EKC/KEOPS complex subunit GON7 n=1 Tax=Aureobasidium pullulans TaxID=5580 RepID=A0A4S9CXD9_AURPU|nr:hypothetical protein D6D13_05068 [Aureobasidium pullulans]